MMGKPVVAGTRITVELILEKLASGETVEQLLGAHPRLTEEGIFAAQALRADVIYPIAEQTYEFTRALSTSPEFMEIIQAARAEFQSGKKLSLEEMKQEVLE